MRGGVCPSAAILQCFYKTRTERPLTLIAGALRTCLCPHWLGRTHMRNRGKGGEGMWAASAPSAYPSQALGSWSRRQDGSREQGSEKAGSAQSSQLRGPPRNQLRRPGHLDSITFCQRSRSRLNGFSAERAFLCLQFKRTAAAQKG